MTGSSSSEESQGAATPPSRTTAETLVSTNGTTSKLMMISCSVLACPLEDGGIDLIILWEAKKFMCVALLPLFPTFPIL